MFQFQFPLAIGIWQMMKRVKNSASPSHQFVICLILLQHHIMSSSNPSIKTQLSGIVTNTLAFSFTTALISATYAVSFNRPVGQYALSTATNSGIFGLMFFTFRGTFLTYQQRKNPLYDLKPTQTRDQDELLASALAGGTAAAIISSSIRGPKTVLRSFTTFAVLAGAGQMIFIKANRYRQDIILKSSTAPPTASSKPALAANLKMESDRPVKEYPKDETAYKLQHKKDKDTERKVGLLDWLPWWSPVRSVTDEQYKQMLEDRLKIVNDELKMVESELQNGSGDKNIP